MKKMTFIVFFGFFVATFAEASFGAISYSPSIGETGEAWGWATQAQAEDQAMAYCTVPDCRIVAWVENGCASLAVSQHSTYQYATAWNSDRDWAESEALNACGPDCLTRAWTCSF